jgi:hypothetical protein
LSSSDENIGNQSKDIKESLKSEFINEFVINKKLSSMEIKDNQSELLPSQLE